MLQLMNDFEDVKEDEKDSRTKNEIEHIETQVYELKRMLSSTFHFVGIEFLTIEGELGTFVVHKVKDGHLYGRTDLALQKTLKLKWLLKIRII